jgi:predicted lipid-binding transport protein (Tim44 family)
MKELIKRADGSYSQRGLWDNIRAKAEKNKKTGATPKKFTDEMRKQERKIKANSKMMGGMLGGAKAGPTFKVNSGLGTAIAAGGLALAASKLFGGKGDVLPDVGKMKYGGKMKNC